MSKCIPFVFALVALGGCGEGEEPVRAVDAWFEASDGVGLHFVEYAGEGTAVVLLHGLTSSGAATWEANGIAAELAERHRVIVLDQRGHGESDKPYEPGAYGGRMVTDVVELMDHLDIERAHIAGYSMGAAITGALLNVAPQRFITASFGGNGVPEADEALRKAAEALDPVGVDPEEIELLKMVEEGLIEGPVVDDAAIAALVTGWGAWGPPPIDLSVVDFPVLAVNGEFDRFYSQTVRMVRELPVFQSVVIPGRGHVSTLIDPLFRGAIVGFIDANDGE